MTCPSCKEPMGPDARDLARNKYFPFCGKKCQMVDLGHWFNEDYKVSRPSVSMDEQD